MELKTNILSLYKDDENYGYPRMTIKLNNSGYKVNHKRVYHYMKDLCLTKPVKKKRPSVSLVKILYINTKLGINLIRDIKAERPGQIIQSDFTEIKKEGKKLYLIVNLCQFSKYVLNWKISDSPNIATVLSCINPLMKKLKGYSYFHQDQGSVFTSNQFCDTLLSHGHYISYSEAGTPSDNAEVESFFSRLKAENKNTFEQCLTIDELKEAIDKAIHYYNTKRIHTAIKDTPLNVITNFVPVLHNFN